MTSTISSNNKKNSLFALTKWSLLKSLPVAAVYSGLLFLAFSGLFFILDATRQLNNYSSVKIVLAYLIPAIVMIFTVVIGANMFGIFHKKRSMDLYGSLPVKRTTLFLSKYIAGLIILLIPLFIFGLLGGITPYFSSVCKEEYNVVAVVMARCTTLAFCIIASYTMFSFLALCCGTTANTIISYTVINLVWPILICIVAIVFACVVPGFGTIIEEMARVDYNILDYNKTGYSLQAPSVVWGIITYILSPMVGTFISVDIDLFNIGIPDLFKGGVSNGEFFTYLFLFVTVVLVLSLCIVKKRKNEDVQNGFIYKLPRVIITLLLTFIVGLFTSSVFIVALVNKLNIPGAEIILYIFGAFIGCLFSFTLLTLIYNRGVGGFIKSLPMIGVPYAVLLLGGFIISTGAFGLDTYVPKVDDIESVAISSDMSWTYPSSYDAYLNRKSDDEYISENYCWYLDEDENIVPMNFYMTDENIIKDTVAVHKSIADNLHNICGLYNMQAILYDADNIENADSADLTKSPSYIYIVYKMKDGSVIKRAYENTAYNVDEIHGLFNKIISSDSYKNQYYALTQCDSKRVSEMTIAGGDNGKNPFICENSEVDSLFKTVNSQQVSDELYEALRKDFMADKSLADTFDIENYDGISNEEWFCGDEKMIVVVYDNIRYSNKLGYEVSGIISESFVIPKDKYTNTWNVLEKYSNDELDFEGKAVIELHNSSN